MMFSRLFSTARPVLRVVPGAPAGVKRMPVPKTARTTQEIRKAAAGAGAVEVEVEQASTSSASFLAASGRMQQIFPDPESDLQLHDPEGVWYHVEKSRAGNLPVYLDYNKSGGVWTEIRKIKGSAGALRNDLKALLSLTNDDIWLKQTANHVVIKGNRSAEVKHILRNMEQTQA